VVGVVALGARLEVDGLAEIPGEEARVPDPAEVECPHPLAQMIRAAMPNVVQIPARLILP
jgi:hypothetical protein